MTYTPGLNGGRINATIGGNTAGVGALVSTGSMTLAGGNNITLSQAGNAITISGGAGGGAGSNTLGMSNLGNTVGTSGVISGSALQYALAGGNNVTLSQSLNGSSGTLTISAANQSVQTQNLVGDVVISGNTLGATADISSGTMTLAGGSNVSLSQNGNAISINAIQSVGLPNQGNTAGNTGYGRLGFAIMGGNNITLSGSSFISYQSVTVSGPNMLSVGMSNIGNTVGTSGMVSNQMVLAGGNNITLSQSTAAGGNTISISAPNQSNQSAGLYAVSNTTQSSSATVDARSMSFAGAGIASVGASNGSVVISVPAGGGAGFTAGMSNLGNTSGTSGTVNNQLVLVGGDNITLSQSTAAGGATISISAAAPGGGGNDLDFYQNMDRGTSASLATAHRTLMLQRLNQENNEFGHNITANTFLLNMTANMTATSLSSSHSVSMSIGIYLDNSTALSLINSASTSWGFTADTGNTKYYHGPRWISFVSSQWSAAPAFSSGNDYVFGVIVNSSNYGPPISYIGQNYMHSLQRSGTIGASAATATSLAQGNYWNAMHSATQSALPTTIASNVVNRNNATAIFMPHIIMNNRYSGTF